jgi:hypothetical protein
MVAPFSLNTRWHRTCFYSITKTMLNNFDLRPKYFLLMALLVSGFVIPRVEAQNVQQKENPGTTVTTTASPPPASTPYRNQPDRIAKRAAAYYESIWGIESPSVKAVESGVILRFSYRVLDPQKAKTLNDKKLEPSLICPEKGLKLEIPSMEKVGKLRQTNTPEAGKSYWMAFSNSGRLLKRGDRVDIVIGNFHASGLLIE